MIDADLVQGLPQVGGRSEGRADQRLPIVEQHDRAALGTPARVHHLLRRLHILAKYILPSVRREADKIQVGKSRTLVGQPFERIAEQDALRGEHGFRTCVHSGVAHAGVRRFAPPRLVGIERIGEPDRRSQQQAAADRAQPNERRRRGERDGHSANQHDDDPADDRVFEGESEAAEQQGGGAHIRQRNAVPGSAAATPSRSPAARAPAAAVD